ncbi:MAG: serine/threonine-protein kinase [Herpetosiphonaceae bacterium]|nr:serine/threonine-protein kinase [Herpetosiphonaceae bacterium]
MQCPVCASSNSATAKFCNTCSAALTPMTGRLPINQLLTGRYLILHLMTQTMQSAVYKAQDTRLGHTLVVVKEMLAPHGGDPTAIQQAITDFQRQADLLAKHLHPNLPHVIDSFKEGDRYFLVMEYIEGQTLRQLLEATQGPLPEARVLDWAVQLCAVLTFLHTRQPPIIYRDLKPDNIMLQPNGTIKLIDFGIARLYQAGKTVDTVPLGTRGYAAPEQFGGGQSDERTDVYALGAVLYELLTAYDVSQTPFQFPPARQRNPQISARTELVLQQALQHDPDQRFQHITSFARALQATAASQSFTVPMQPPAVQRRLIWPLLGVGVTLLLGGAGWGGWYAWAANHPPATATTIPTQPQVAMVPSNTPTPVATTLPTASTLPPSIVVPTVPPPPTDTVVPTTTSEPPPTRTIRSTVTLVPSWTPAPTATPTSTSTPSPTSLVTGTASPTPPNGPPTGHLAFAIGVPTGDTSKWHIETLDLTTGQRQALPGTGTGNDINPVWSPDGQHIAFAAEASGNRDIWLMDAAGSHAERLTSGHIKQQYPTWSPRGDALIFTYNKSDTADALYRIDASGQQGVDLGVGGNASWSVNDQIIFSLEVTPYSHDIWQMGADGSGRAKLVDTPDVNEEFAVWSPDGQHIAFTSNPVITNNEDDLHNRQIWIMDADGSNRHQVTSGRYPATNAAWSPDAQWVAFVVQQSVTTSQVWIVRADGTQAHQLTADKAKKFYLSWTR